MDKREARSEVPGQTRWAKWVSQHGLISGLVVGVSVTLIAVLVVLWLIPPPAEKGELVILSGRDDSVGRQRQVLIEQWNRSHPANPARIEEVSRDPRNEMVKRAQAADSNIDIYNLDLTWTAEFAENNYIRRLSGVSTDGFLDKPLSTCFYEKRLDGVPFSGESLYALPFNTDAGLLYYRSDLVSRPEGWDSVISETRRVLGQRADPALKAGYTGQLDTYEGLTVNVLEAIRDVGGTIGVDENGNLQLDLDKAQVAVDRLRPRQGDDYPIVLPESLGYDEQRSTQAMREGKVLFLRNWPLAYRTLVAPSGEETAAGGRRFEVTQLPGGSSILGGQNLAVSRHSAEPRAATRLIEFLTSEPSQRLLFEEGGFAATRQSVYDNPSIQARYAYTQELRKAVNSAEPRPQGPCYGRFSEIFRSTVAEALGTGNPLPDDFVDRLGTALNCQPTDDRSAY